MLSTGAPLSEWLAWLETLSPKEIDLGLDRVSDVLARLNLTRPDHVLLIAGTNGKGSSVTMAAALLCAAGHRVGAYTSPHISRFNERIVVDGRMVSDAEIIAAFETVEVARKGTELTYFEFSTLAAATIYAALDLDVWILEVGLGGRLDATNVIDPTASLITNISLDHCDWLGHDIEAIGHEKAGVMRPAKPTIFGGHEMPDAVRKHAAAIGADLFSPGHGFSVAASASGDWDWAGPSQRLESLQPPGLVGAFQIDNAAAVLALLDVAGLMDGIDDALVNRVLPHISLAGRAQRLEREGREWLLDVAHNPAAAEMLATTLASSSTPRQTIAIVGLLDDKDVAGVIGPLTGHVDQWVVMAAESHRAVAADELGRQISNLADKACFVADSVVTAIDFARRSSSKNDRILVTGSFSTVGPVLDQLATMSRPNQ